MGNQMCCQQPLSEQNKETIYSLTPYSPENGDAEHSSRRYDQTYNTPLPTLSQDIQTILNQYKPFEQQFNHQVNIKTSFGNDVYLGPLNENKKPTKIGKMYKENGAFFIGYFIDGKAEGPCFYVFNDGSYFQGQMKDNKTECSNATYLSKTIQYHGGFHNNQFHGKGSERARNQLYSFEGIYQNGKKKSGIMQWGNKNFEYFYQGQFNEEGKFTGKGKLTEPEGAYQGDFVNGQKHGSGTYFYNTKLRYEGQYKRNIKQGQGRIINNDGSIAYKGVFKNGLPNGKGVAISKNGLQFEANWVDGIDARLL